MGSPGVVRFGYLFSLSLRLPHHQLLSEPAGMAVVYGHGQLSLLRLLGLAIPFPALLQHRHIVVLRPPNRCLIRYGHPEILRHTFRRQQSADAGHIQIFQLFCG